MHIHFCDLLYKLPLSVPPEHCLHVQIPYPTKFQNIFGFNLNMYFVQNHINNQVYCKSHVVIFSTFFHMKSFQLNIWDTCISSWSCGSWLYNYLCNQCQCLSPLKLWVRTSFMSRYTRYSFSVTCDRSMISSGFLHQ